MKIPKDLRWQPTGRTLGQGGQAQVYLVEDKNNPDAPPAALKALRNNGPGPAYERFYREISAVKELDHPSIIKILDHSSPDSDFHYYVMEYVEGAKPLSIVFESRNNPFFNNPYGAVELFKKICEAIFTYEKSGSSIVHRDLCPANILYLPDGSIKIIDFGICQIDEQEPLTLTDEGIGTINYMAPECESGSPEKVGIAADLYSAGKILWSAISGKRAFARESPVFTNRSMDATFPNNPKAWHLFHIFNKTIRRDWRERWGSADQAISESRFVMRLISDGYQPLELLTWRCPVCGVGKLGPFDGSHMVFGNPNPRGIVAVQCSYCGVCLAFNSRLKRDNLKSRETLE